MVEVAMKLPSPTDIILRGLSSGCTSEACLFSLLPCLLDRLGRRKLVCLERADRGVLYSSGGGWTEGCVTDDIFHDQRLSILVFTIGLEG